MKIHITPFDLVEPITAVHVDQGRQELTAVFNSWASIRAIRPSQERVVYSADQKQLKALYRVWMDAGQPLESEYLVKWQDRFFELASEPVKDATSPWLYFVMKEVTYDVSNFIET